MASIIYKGKQTPTIELGGSNNNYFSVTTVIENNNSPIKAYTNDGVRLNDKNVPNQLTFCAWIKTSLARYQLLLTNATFFATSTSTFPFTTNITASGNLAFGLDAGDGDFSYEESGGTTGINVADNNWHHIGIMYKGNDYFKFYVDGVQVLNQSIAFSSNNPGTLDWCFGIPHQWNSASPSDYGFNGSMAYLIFAPGFVDESIIIKAYLDSPPFPLPDSLWTPSQITTSLWLDASVSSSIVLDGSNKVSQWLDLSGNNRHAIQTTATNRPTVSTGYLNSLDSIQFNGTDQFLTGSSSNPIGDSDDFTILAVAKGSFFTRGSDNASGWSAWAQSDNVAVVTSSPVAGYVAAGGTFISDAIHGMEWDSGTSLKRHINGSLVDTNSSVGTGLRSSSITYNIGLINTSFSACIISELIIVNSLLNQNNFDRLTGYLAHKRNLQSTLPSGHPYKTSPPTIFG